MKQEFLKNQFVDGRGYEKGFTGKYEVGRPYKKTLRQIKKYGLIAIIGTVVLIGLSGECENEKNYQIQKGTIEQRIE